jgi:hypothetical protein
MASLPLAYVPAIHVFLALLSIKAWMPRTSPGMTKQPCMTAIKKAPAKPGPFDIGDAPKYQRE